MGNVNLVTSVGRLVFCVWWLPLQSRWWQKYGPVKEIYNAACLLVKNGNFKVEVLVQVTNFRLQGVAWWCGACSHGPQHGAMGTWLLSPQKQGVRSCAARSRGARRQGWPWRWGTGWPVRPAGSRRTGAWTATALRESKQRLWLWLPGVFLHETGSWSW